MWTPRRIFLSLVGLLIAAGGYFGYARFLGSLDGLPPLPDKYLPDPSGDTFLVSNGGGLTTLERQIEKAFGTNSPELRYPIKTENRKNRVLICAHVFRIIDKGPREGWVEVAPLSMATYSDKPGPDGLEEINTVYCDVAYLKFDRPLRSMAEFSGRKMVAAELHANPEAQLPDPRKGRVRLLNNRRTFDLHDDIEMVTPGPVYYESDPKPGRPHIYTVTEVHVTDHSNTELPKPNRSYPRDPTVTGVGLQVYLTREPKDKQPAKGGAKKAVTKKKDDRSPIKGLEIIGLEHSVKMNLWTDPSSSFVAPGSGKKSEPDTPRKDEKAEGKRLLQIETNGPFRYDLINEIAHFEKPAVQKPGLVELVTVKRTAKSGEQDLLICEYLDVAMKPKQEMPSAKDAIAKKKDNEEKSLEVKSIRAWGENVLMTSDEESLHATGSELIHDAEERMTILKGSPSRKVQAVKDGNLLHGSELHLFGDDKQITQAHILGAGSIGIGELDPKTREFQKQAIWTDRLVYTRITEKLKPPVDVFTIIGKDGDRAVFRDTSSGKLEQLEGQQLKVWVRPADEKKDRPRTSKSGVIPASKSGSNMSQAADSSRLMRVEGRELVRCTSPELIIKHADYLNVLFQDVPKLLKPPKPEPKKAETPKAAIPEGPVKFPTTKPPVIPPKEAKEQPKATPIKKKEIAKEAEKPPLVVEARSIETWVNRDPQGKTEIDKVHAVGNVDIKQDPVDGKQSMHIAGRTVDVQAYAEGHKLIVTGDPSDKAKQKWGVVRFDELTMFGYDIVIDQRTDTSVVRGEGWMEILSKSDLEGKKLEKPTVVTIYWKHRMDFLGADKLIYYHGGVQAYEQSSRCKCEWMQVLLDRPMYLDPERREKARQNANPGDKDKKTDAQIDTVMFFHAPKDESIPKPKELQPVTIVQEEREGEKLIRFQSIQAPDVVTVNTPLPNKKARHDLMATSSHLMPGTVRIWQAGKKDDGANPAIGDPEAKRAPRKKGELAPDEEMKLTVVQFGEKMWAQDFRKRAKFWTNVRVIHLPADKPNMPVDLRLGEIPEGAIYLEARDTLEVYSTPQIEKDEKGKEVEVSYQEMEAIGNVRVRKQGEFFGDADRITYSELKGTITFHGTDKNPATVNQIVGQGIPNKSSSGRKLIYHLKTKTVTSEGGVQIKN